LYYTDINRALKYVDMAIGLRCSRIYNSRFMYYTVCVSICFNYYIN
jgi:hypothetical protein